MNRTVLQIPLDATLRREAEEGAIEQGFSSLQEALRVFMKKLAQRTVNFTVKEGVQLSDKAIKRYNKMIDDIESGKEKTYSFTNIDNLMKHLNS